MNFMEKLSENQLKELGIFAQDNKNKVQEIKRAQAILLLNEKAIRPLLYELTGIKRATAVKIRKKYLKEGLGSILSKAPEKQPRMLLTKGQLEEIKEMLHQQTPRDYGYAWNHWVPSIVGELILQLYGVKYKSKTSLHLIFKKSKFTYHKPEKKYKNRNEQAIKKWQGEMEPVILQVLSDPNTVLLVADEMIITSQTTLQKIWLPEGQYPIVDCANTRKRRSIYGFLNIKTGQQLAFKSECQNGETTVRFLKKVIAQYPNKQIVIVWDNASWHKSLIVREFLSTVSNLKLYNFPPYAPEENPQEHVWKAGRAHVTHNTFIPDIDVAARQIVTYLSTNLFNYEFFGFKATL